MPNENKPLNLTERKKIEELMASKFAHAETTARINFSNAKEAIFKELKGNPPAKVKEIGEKIKKNLEENRALLKKLNETGYGYNGAKLSTFCGNEGISFEIGLVTSRWVNGQHENIPNEKALKLFPPLKQLVKEHEARKKEIRDMKDKLQLALYVNQTELETVVKEILTKLG